MRANVLELFNRLEDKQKTVVLQIIIKRLVINHESNIIFLKLHSPFSHLSTLAVSLDSRMKEGDSPRRILDSRKLSRGESESYFDMLSFGNRMNLGELPV